MSRKKAFRYILISIIAIILGSILLIRIWGISDQKQFSVTLAVILIMVGCGILSISITRVIIQPDVEFGIGDLVSRRNRDQLRVRVGKRNARKISIISDFAFVMLLSILVLLFILLSKKCNLH